MKKIDYFKDHKIDYIDYKDAETLKKFLTPHARIQAKRQNGLSSTSQRGLALAIKRARFMGFLPYITR